MQKARRKGWRVLKNGWPDYMLIRKTDAGQLEFQAVEVKQDHETDPLREAQKLMLSVLTFLGMKCYVWSAETSTLRKVDLLDAKRVINDYINREDAEQTANAINELKRLGGLVRYV